MILPSIGNAEGTINATMKLFAHIARLMIGIGKVNSAYEPSGLSGQHLSPVSIA